MYITYLSLQNIRCFDTYQKIDLSSGINLLVGHNNSGKSTILKSIYHLQVLSFTEKDITIYPYSDELSSSGEIITGLCTRKNYYNFNGYSQDPYTTENIRDPRVSIRIYKNQDKSFSYYNQIRMINISGGNNLDVSFTPYQSNSDDNLLYPYFSNRKVENYSKSSLLSDRKKLMAD